MFSHIIARAEYYLEGVGIRMLQKLYTKMIQKRYKYQMFYIDKLRSNSI